MSGDKDVGGFLKGLIFKDSGEAGSEEPATAATATSSSSGSAPVLLSTLTTATAPVTTSKSTGPSTRTLEMLTEAQKQVPADNAQFKLDAAMESIKALEPDATKRRAMALAMLASQGISAEKVSAEAAKAREIMAGVITSLSSQLSAKRESAVVSVRAQAASVREQGQNLEADITRIREQQAELNIQAGVFEVNANTEEGNLNGIAADIEAALAIINSGAK